MGEQHRLVLLMLVSVPFCIILGTSWVKSWRELAHATSCLQKLRGLQRGPSWLKLRRKVAR